MTTITTLPRIVFYFPCASDAAAGGARTSRGGRGVIFSFSPQHNKAQSSKPTAEVDGASRVEVDTAAAGLAPDVTETRTVLACEAPANLHGDGGGVRKDNRPLRIEKKCVEVRSCARAELSATSPLRPSSVERQLQQKRAARPQCVCASRRLASARAAGVGTNFLCRKTVVAKRRFGCIRRPSFLHRADRDVKAHGNLLSSGARAAALRLGVGVRGDGMKTPPRESIPRRVPEVLSNAKSEVRMVKGEIGQGGASLADFTLHSSPFTPLS